MDNYSEQLVVKLRTTADTVRIIAIILLTSLIAAGLVFLALISGFLLLIFGGMAAFLFGIWLVSGMGVEYEYIITNTDLDIDKIIGKRKRKRMISIDLTRTVDFAPIKDKTPECDVTVRAYSGADKDVHYLVAEHTDYGKVKVIFNPNQKTKEAIAQALPRELRSRMVLEHGK